MTRMTAAARIAEALAGRKVTARGGNYRVRCPAHNDNTPSLSLKDGPRGLLVHCFAGCDPRDVLAAIRLKYSRLLEADQPPMPGPGSNSTEYERRQHEKAGGLW